MPGYDPARAAEIRPRLTLTYLPTHHKFLFDDGTRQRRHLYAVAWPVDAGDYWRTAAGALTRAARAFEADLYADDDLATRRAIEVERRANGSRISVRTAYPRQYATPNASAPLLPTLTPAERTHLDQDRLAAARAGVAAGEADRPGHARRLLSRALTVAPESMVAAVADALREQEMTAAENRVAAPAILAALVEAVAAEITDTRVATPDAPAPAPRWGRLPRITLNRS